MQCNLCKSTSVTIFNTKNNNYYKCANCLAIYMDSESFVSKDKEIERYKEHNNNVNDLGYQKFVNPIVNKVLSNYKNTHKGLDFGCGTGPVVTKLLRDKAYNITTYDPFFDNNIKALKTTYDYIVCCEVIEHFHNPLQEFQLLKSLLNSKGKLFCMTDVYNETIVFDNWYYRNDQTHVIFYQQKTLEWLAKHLNFSKVTVEKRLIIFEN